MADTPGSGVRIDPELAARARAELGDPDATLPLSVVVRAALAFLAGASIPEALKSAHARPGPKPKAGASA